MPIIVELLNEATYENAAGCVADVIADRSSAAERYTPRLNFEFD